MALLSGLIDFFTVFSHKRSHGVLNHLQALKATHHETIPFHVSNGPTQDDLLGLALKLSNFLQNGFCKFKHGDFP